MHRLHEGPSLQLVAKLILFLVLTCDARTINDCSEFVSVKIWKYRRQLLIHHSNLWLREVAAWEASQPYAYVLREATDGERSFQGIYDENMTLRSCQITDDYTEEGNTRLISDMRHECRQNAIKIGQEPSDLFEKLLNSNSHSASTFDDIHKLLNDGDVSYQLKDGSHHDMYDDKVRVSEQPSEAEDGPSIEVYRYLTNAVPSGLRNLLDFEETVQMCNALNIDIINRNIEDVSSLTSWLPKSLREIPRTVRKRLEAIGIVDEEEEEEDMNDIVEEDDEMIISGEDDDHHERQKRGLFMFPGTLWCGTGNRAPTYDSLGMYNKTDMCCRDHDHSTEDMSISSGATKYNFKNWGMFTITHCSIDKRFHKCLRQVRNMAAYEVGRGFFNVFNIQCFVIRNRKQCLEHYWYMPWKCKQHEYQPTACPRSAQVFPSQKYVWPS
ncbi:uncharacterized protein [Apostichopus japonicus]|uniref:uncharacterized protein n=1 Tax=Stichopus japonicus TaxID=307972 RepID=UPI003AB44E01